MTKTLRATLILTFSLLFFGSIFSVQNASAQSVPGRGGTGDLLMETWETTTLYNRTTQPSRLYNEFDNPPLGETKVWTRSLSIDGCFAQSKVVDGSCATKDPSKDQNYYGPLLNSPGAGIDIIEYQGRKVNRYWIQQDTYHSHGARLNLQYNYLGNYINRRIYARYYMMFPKKLPVVDFHGGGLWTSVGVEMKAHGWNTNATIQHNYNQSNQMWLGSPFVDVTVNNPITIQENKWYKMDVIWDMYPDGRGKWQAFVDGVKFGEATGQMATNNGYGLWIFNLYGNMFQNQVRGEMYIGDVILSTQPIGDELPESDSPTPTATPEPIDNFGLTKLTASTITASSDDGNVPQNTVDANFGTRWSACGVGEWIRYDLGAVKRVGHINIAFYNAETQVAKFDIEVSSDGSNWTKVYSGQSGTHTSEFQQFDFGDVTTRYVRIVGNGNLTTSASCWNSYTEVAIYGEEVEVSDSPVCAADINQDGIVDITDFSIMKFDFLKTNPSNPRSNINGDSVVDLTDYLVLKSNFLKTCTLFNSAANNSAPSPTTNPTSPSSQTSSLSISHFELISTETGQVLETFQPGNSYSIQSSNTHTIKAVPTSLPKSVRWTESNNYNSTVLVKDDNTNPFTIECDGTWGYCSWPRGVGVYTIKAQGFSAVDGTGEAGPEAQITITVTQ